MIDKIIKRPTLVLDETKCRENIQRMSIKTSSQGKEFRPHFKTHQSHLVGRWFRDAGVKKIAVSSLAMASYFLEDGWNDITVAFPLNLRETELLDNLAGRVHIHQTILSLESVQLLDKTLRNSVSIWLKIDTGYKRTGIPWDRMETLDPILNFLIGNEKIQFRGFLVHAGHTYKAHNPQELIHIYNDSIQKLSVLRKRYLSVFPQLQISWGDTPSCSMIGRLEGVDEIRPGNFVFYDIMQSEIGSCTTDQIAVALACPVVAKHPERKAIIIYGGGVHLSKESLQHEGTTIFGKIALHEGNGWGEPLSGSHVTSLSQEHGVIVTDESGFNKIRVGELIYVMPVHSCMTADLMQGYLLTNGKLADHMSGKKNKSWL